MHAIAVLDNKHFIYYIILFKKKKCILCPDTVKEYLFSEKSFTLF